jgi:mRNA interferase RelE/StbE
VSLYQIEFLPSARKELTSFPRGAQERIGKKIDSLSINPRPHGVEKLEGKRGSFYRLRVGDYRILYEIQDEILLILVIKVGHRREVYRRMSS